MVPLHLPQLHVPVTSPTKDQVAGQVDDETRPDGTGQEVLSEAFYWLAFSRPVNFRVSDFELQKCMLLYTIIVRPAHGGPKLFTAVMAAA